MITLLLQDTNTISVWHTDREQRHLKMLPLWAGVQVTPSYIALHSHSRVRFVNGGLSCYMRQQLRSKSIKVIVLQLQRYHYTSPFTLPSCFALYHYLRIRPLRFFPSSKTR
jgi:hypothetical protein